MRCVAVVLVLLAAGCGRGANEVATTTTTSTTEAVTTTTEEPTTTTVVAVTTTAKPVEAKEKQCASAPAAETQPRPDDWATYWQTEPDANQPMTMTICIDDSKPAVGQLVTLTVTADDPDATIKDGDCDIYVSWMSNPGNLCRDYMSIGEPQPTPAKEHGHVVKTYTHTYTKAQTYLVEVDAASSEFTGKRHPYASSAVAQLHLAVHL
jgi:hypothetical protein